jgi:hypothetical protein
MPALRAFAFLLPLALESQLSTLVKIKTPLSGHSFLFAEREGFEPSIQV